MPPFLDLTGRRIERLTVLRRSAAKCGKHIQWDCVCDCGAMVTALSTNLSRGHTKSCGCLRADTMAQMVLKHGKSETPEFSVWLGMISRCKHDARYAGRGIKVCDGWSNSFELFIQDMGTREPGLSIDRINNDLGYFCGHCEQCIQNKWPANCRWTTCKTQARNRRTNHWIEFNGETGCIKDWADRLKTSTSTLGRRIRLLGLEVGLTRPLRRRKKQS